MSRFARVLLLSAALPIGAEAQVTITVPIGLQAQDGEGLAMLPGASGAARAQWIYGASLMQGAQRRQITGLTLRRDGGRIAFAAGDAHLRVTIAEVVGLDPWRAAPNFAANLGSRAVVVFDGVVHLPASPKPASRGAVTWTAPDAIALPFAAPFPYAGTGALCVQIEGQLGASPIPFWAIDVQTTGFAGRVTYVGQACGAVAQRVRHPGNVGERWLRPGSTARFVNLAPVEGAGAMLLGTEAFAQGLSLAPYGAPGCELWLTPAVIVPTFARSVSGTHVPAAANTRLQMPAGASVLGSCLVAQWMNYDGLVLTTTNAVKATIALQMPGLDAAMVSCAPTAGPLPAFGDVQTGRVAVVRFDLR